MSLHADDNNLGGRGRAGVGRRREGVLDKMSREETILFTIVAKHIEHEGLSLRYMKDIYLKLQ